MADGKKQEAAVLSLPDDVPDENVKGSDQHNLPVLVVSESDRAEPDPRHAGPEKLGAPADVFDPNAALRKARGVGPGLQDSEAKNPAVWVDQDSQEARDASAKYAVDEAQRALDRAKAAASAIKKGEPLAQELP